MRKKCVIGFYPPGGFFNTFVGESIHHYRYPSQVYFICLILAINHVMKKKCFLVAMLVSGIGTMASAQVRIGVEAGVNVSHYLTDQKQLAEQKGGVKAGFQVGIDVGYEFEKHWTLSTGLTLLQNRSTMKLSPFNVTHFPDTEIKINNLYLPLKIGYHIHVSDRFSLMPSLGLYASYGFNAGSCSLDMTHPAGYNEETVTGSWKPMNGYSYPLKDSPNNARAVLDPFRHWEYGALCGVKAIFADHYTIGFNYMAGIKQVHDSLGLRNSNFQLNIGYQF